MCAVPVKTIAVLVVEDDPFVLEETQMTLDRQGFEVLTAENAEVALELLETRADIGVMVTDIEMPGMNGLELSREVRDRWPPVGIIIISSRGHPSPTDIPQRGLYFSKPADLQTLGHAIRSLRR